MTQLEPDLPGDYAAALAVLKGLVRDAQHQAQRVVNTAMIELYWNIGRTILDRQRNEPWGSKVLDRLARDLRAEFPHMKGFSRTNLYNMRTFAAAWNGPEPIVQTPSGQLSWSHNVALLNKLDDHELAAGTPHGLSGMAGPWPHWNTRSSPGSTPAAARPRTISRPDCPAKAPTCGTAPPPDSGLLRVHVVLEDSRPPIWRVLDLQASMTLDGVHRVMQAAFGCQDTHLHRFTDLHPFERLRPVDGEIDWPLEWLPRDLVEDPIDMPEEDMTLGQLLGRGSGTAFY